METNDIDLLENIEKVHTTIMGIDRIIKNLQINTADVVEWCKTKILDKHCVITRKGKNWYADIDNYVITINAHSYTIITAHKQK